MEDIEGERESRTTSALNDAGLTDELSRRLTIKDAVSPGCLPSQRNMGEPVITS